MGTKSKRVLSSHGGNVVDYCDQNQTPGGYYSFGGQLNSGISYSLLLFVLMGLVHPSIAMFLLVPM